MYSSLTKTSPFDNSGNLYVPCPSHPAYFITNICTLPSCIEPLCQECINHHIANHSKKTQTPTIHNIQHVKHEQKELVLSYIKQLSIAQVTHTQSFLQSQLAKLQQAKKNVLLIVDEVFASQEHQLKYRLQQLGIDNTIQELDINNEISKLQKVAADFDTSDYVNAIIYSLDRNIQKRQKSYLDLKELEEQLPEISINYKVRDDIYQVISSYIVIAKPFFHQNQNKIEKTPEGKHHPQPNHHPQAKEKSNGASQPAKVHFATTTQELLENKIQNHPQIYIKNQTDLAKMIINFEDDTKVCRFLLFKEKGQVSTQYLDIESRIPCNHSCVPVGESVFVLGGILKDTDRFEATNQVFRLDFQEKKLVYHSSMIERRQDMGACAVGSRWIYVCGGSRTNHEEYSLQSLERLDTIGAKWQKLSPSRKAGIGITLETVNNKFLLKVGGMDVELKEIRMVEVYNILNDQWSVLSIFDQNGEIWKDIGARMGVKQINDKEVLIFGGDIEDRQVDDCWVVTLDIRKDIESSSIRRSFSLPIPGDVKQKALINEGSIYAFVNSNSEGEQVTTRLLVGSQEEWKCY